MAQWLKSLLLLIALAIIAPRQVDATVQQPDFHDSLSESASGGQYTQTINYPDGTWEERVYDKWQLDTVTRFATNGSTVEETSFHYDGLGNLDWAKAHRNGTDYTTHFNWDDQNRIASIVGPDSTNAITRIFYYGDTTRVRQVVRPNGSTLSYVYDDAGRVTHQKDGSGNDADYDYDSLGRLTEMTTWQNGAAKTTTWEYNETSGLLEHKRVNGSIVESYTYRDNGQIETITDANNVAATVSYDSGGSVSQVAHSDGFCRDRCAASKRSGPPEKPAADLGGQPGIRGSPILEPERSRQCPAPRFPGQQLQFRPHPGLFRFPPGPCPPVGGTGCTLGLEVTAKGSGLICYLPEHCTARC